LIQGFIVCSVLFKGTVARCQFYLTKCSALRLDFIGHHCDVITNGGETMRQLHSELQKRVRAIGPDVLSWSRGARHVMKSMVRKYGLPNEVVTSRLTWYNNGSWKRSVVHRFGVLHRFPMVHRDYLEQVIECRIPAEKIGDLAEFNGSVMVDRTAGEVTAHCYSEEVNYLLMNLMHDIALGNKTPEEARKMCASVTAALRMKWPMPYAAGLRFSTDLSVVEAGMSHSDPDDSMHVIPGWY
jgi:hypothetical protein